MRSTRMPAKRAARMALADRDDRAAVDRAVQDDAHDARRAATTQMARTGTPAICTVVNSASSGGGLMRRPRP